MLAQLQPDTPPKPSPAVRNAVGHWAALTLLSTLILLGVVFAVLALSSRWVRRAQSPARNRRARSRPDPWREAGRRAAPEPVDPDADPDGDTVDLDPPPDTDHN